MRGACALSLALLLAAAPAHAQIFRWVDEDGGVHYSHGADSVPERLRSGSMLSPDQRAAAAEALAALRDMQPFVTTIPDLADYHARLSRMNTVVGPALRRIDDGPVRAALTAARDFYVDGSRILGRLYNSPVDTRSVLSPAARACGPVASVLRDPPVATARYDEAYHRFGRAVFRAVLDCAQIATAEAERDAGLAAPPR